MGGPSQLDARRHVLLVDEVLAVGDERFTHKCLDKFAELRRRGKTILLVTHSPQVAARAERHFRITRVRDSTQLLLLSDYARVEEIARMLAGASVSDEARAAARRLLAEAREPRKSRRDSTGL